MYVDGDSILDCDSFPGDTPNPQEWAADRQRLDTVLSAIDKIISEAAYFRRNPDRDTEIARLGLERVA